MSVRTTVVVLAGILAGIAVGWWATKVRGSAAEGAFAGAAAFAATIRFLHEMVDRNSH